MWEYNHNDELYHHGIKGQKWGVRRFQNEDGTLTEAGKKKYRKQEKARSKTMYDLRFHDAMYESKIRTATRDKDKYTAKGDTKSADRVRRTIGRYERSRKALGDAMSKISGMDVTVVKSRDITRLGKDVISRLTAAEMSANRRGEYGAWAGDIHKALNEKRRIEAALSRQKG